MDNELRKQISEAAALAREYFAGAIELKKSREAAKERLQENLKESREFAQEMRNEGSNGSRYDLEEMAKKSHEQTVKMLKFHGEVLRLLSEQNALLEKIAEKLEAR